LGYRKYLVLIFFIVACSLSYGQNGLNKFLKPSDTLNVKRQNTVLLSEGLLATATLAALNQLWYADYPQSKFHLINDNQEWLQVDKLGHAYSSYHLGRFSSEALKWSGASQRKQLLYGAGVGFAFLTTVELMDGFSSQWGFSMGDIVANASGTALYVSQELLWKEQRIQPKFSFHRTQYAPIRPTVLGGNLAEEILKDYNGQTYWLSVNLHSFAKASKIPKWLNLAVGYGADGMLTGNGDYSDKNSLSTLGRKRQFYLSFDVDLTKLDTNSPFLKTFFTVFNSIKIPAPSIEYSLNEGFRTHILYF
jgi:hypothetical protein